MEQIEKRLPNLTDGMESMDIDEGLDKIRLIDGKGMREMHGYKFNSAQLDG